MMTMSPRTPDRFAPRRLGGIAELADLRAEFGEWLRGLEVGDDLVDDLLIVVSELGANAVRESAPEAEFSTVDAWCDDETLWLEVSNVVDTATHEEIKAEWDLDDPLRTGGRGLLVVSALVDDVDVTVDGRRLSVRCSVDVEGAQRDSTVT